MREWKCKQMEYTDSVLDYLGFHQDTQASDDDGGWEIRKFTYSGSDLIKLQKVWGQNINWTDRANYFA